MHKAGPPPGLRNLGNSCFMNVALQCLSNCQGFPGLLNEHKQACRHSVDEVCVVCLLDDHFRAVNDANTRVLSPKRLYESLSKLNAGFTVGQQHDVHEYFLLLLEACAKEANAPPRDAGTSGSSAGLVSVAPIEQTPHSLSSVDVAATLPRDSPTAHGDVPASPAPHSEHSHRVCEQPSLPSNHQGNPTHDDTSLIKVQDIFGGTLRTETQCSECETVRKRDDPFMDLSLEIVSDGIRSWWAKNKLHKLTHLKDALARFTRKEWLENENAYHCNLCRKLVRASKRVRVVQAPQVLVVHLKRFRFHLTNDHATSSKVSHNVQFDDSLKLMECMVSRNHRSPSLPRFDLFGVISHQGSFRSGGHYIAHVKGPTGQWYKVDDSVVEKTDWNKVAKTEAYMLFYTRDGMRNATRKRKRIGELSAESCDVSPRKLVVAADGQVAGQEESQVALVADEVVVSSGDVGLGEERIPRLADGGDRQVSHPAVKHDGQASHDDQLPQHDNQPSNHANQSSHNTNQSSNHANQSSHNTNQSSHHAAKHDDRFSHPPSVRNKRKASVALIDGDSHCGALLHVAADQMHPRFRSTQPLLKKRKFVRATIPSCTPRTTPQEKPAKFSRFLRTLVTSAKRFWRN